MAARARQCDQLSSVGVKPKEGKLGGDGEKAIGLKPSLKSLSSGGRPEYGGSRHVGEALPLGDASTGDRSLTVKSRVRQPLHNEGDKLKAIASNKLEVEKAKEKLNLSRTREITVKNQERLHVGKNFKMETPKLYASQENGNRKAVNCKNFCQQPGNGFAPQIKREPADFKDVDVPMDSTASHEEKMLEDAKHYTKGLQEQRIASPVHPDAQNKYLGQEFRPKGVMIDGEVNGATSKKRKGDFWESNMEETKRLAVEAPKNEDGDNCEPRMITQVMPSIVGRNMADVRRRRSNDDRFEIVPLKQSKNEFLVSNNIDQMDQGVSRDHGQLDSKMVVHNNDARRRVMKTLLEFRSIYDRLLKDDNLLKASYLAYKIFKEESKGKYYQSKAIGVIPGVKIGDEFRLRVEMVLIGLHCQHEAGIDFIKQHGKNIAISIVSSGRYSRNKTSSSVLHYSGSGVIGEDQKLKRGNLALKNSIDAQVPIRVIHGIHSYQPKEKKKVKVYIYDGLYMAEKYWFHKGKGGCFELTFQLRRIPSQPVLTINEFQQSRKAKSLSRSTKSKGNMWVTEQVMVDAECSMPLKSSTSCTPMLPQTGHGYKGGHKMPFNDNEKDMEVWKQCGHPQYSMA